MTTASLPFTPDLALLLRQKADAGTVSAQEAGPFLRQSELVQALNNPVRQEVLPLLTRLGQLAEIPHTGQLPQVRAWRAALAQKAWFGEGFSLSGQREDLLACYHAMVTTVLIKLEHPDVDMLRKSIDWIVRYQSVERGCLTDWKGKGILKYGGCLSTTPCYIGVVKAIVALSTFKQNLPDHWEEAMELKLKQGLDYLLQHQLYCRLSNDKPITSYICQLSYPFTYKTNLIELLLLMQANGLLGHPSCLSAKAYLRRKQHKAGYWKAPKVYQPKDWVAFDQPGQAAGWITYLLCSLLQE